MEVSSGDLKITSKETKSHILISSINSIQSFEIDISKSRIMEEWNLGLCPVLYRSIRSKLIIVHNRIALDLDRSIWYRMGKKWQTFTLDKESLAHIMQNLTIPDVYRHEILGPLEVDKVEDVTMERMAEKWENIPTSIDVSKWRFLRTSKAMMMEEIWKLMPSITSKNPIGRMSVRSLRYAMRSFYSRNIEYVNSEFRRIMVSRKVVLPIHAPTLLQNSPLCLSSTPQSDKAGLIGELPLGTRVNKDGYVTRVPKPSVSVTGAQCAFPNRMAPTREVVLRAISQAMWLEHENIPVVTSEYIEGGFN